MMHDDEKARLEAYARKLEEANAQLKALDSTRAQILSNVSHELRTPLVTIIGYVEMLAQGAMGETSEEARHALQVVLRNALRLSALIDDLLNLSRLQAEEVRPYMEPFALASLTKEVISEQGRHFDQKGVALEVRIAADLPAIAADRRLTRIVLENLLKNAVKFTPPAGRVTIEALARDERAFVTVRDTGIGVPAQEQQRVFEAFYQTDGSPTRTHGGIGAGLTIVRRIVEAHGGQVRLESTEGAGTAVTFDLPVRPAS